VSGLMWSSIQNWGTRIMTLVVFTVFARVLSPDELGVFAAAMAVLTFVQMFSEQGLTDAIVQRREVSPRLLNTAAAVNLLLAVVVMGALFVAAPHVAQRMAMPALTDVLRFCAFNLLIMALGFSQQAMQRRAFNYRWLAACSFVSTFASGIVGISCAMLGYGVWSLVAQAIVAAVLNTLMLWLRPQWRFGWEFDLQGVKGLLGFGMQRLGANLLDFANTRYVELYIAASLGAVSLGVYAVGVKIYQALMQVMGSVVFGVALGGFSRLAHDRAALHAAYYRSMASASVLALPLFWGVAALAPEIIEAIFGARWMESVLVLQLLGIVGGLQVLQYQNGVMFNAIGRPSVALGFLVFRTAVTFSALWMSGGSDLDRTVTYYAASQALVFVPNFFLARKVLGIDFREVASRVWPFALAAMSALAVVSACRPFIADLLPSAMARGLSLGLVGGLVYVVLALALGRGTVFELRQLLKDRKA